MGTGNRRSVLVVLGLYLVLVMFLIDTAVAGLNSSVPRFFVILAQFYLVKVLGDVVYYRLRPRYRDFASVGEYLVEDGLGLSRFAFPLTVVQRMAEEGALAFGFGIRSWLVQVAGGPYVAIIVYLVNRSLREAAADRRFHAGERLHRLP